jgi:hypothetical protein
VCDRTSRQQSAPQTPGGRGERRWRGGRGSRNCNSAHPAAATDRYVGRRSTTDAATRVAAGEAWMGVSTVERDAHRAAPHRAVRTIAHWMSLWCPHGHDPPVHANQRLPGDRLIPQGAHARARCRTRFGPTEGSGRVPSFDSRNVRTRRDRTDQANASCLVSGTRQQETAPESPGSLNHTIFEGTSEIQQLVIARAISGLRIE